MTRSQSIALTHALTSYASGLATSMAANGAHADLAHITGSPIPVASDAFQYANFDGNASTQLINTVIGSNDPEGPTLSFGGTLTTDYLDTNGGQSDWYPVAGQSDMSVLNSVQSAARTGVATMLASRLSQAITAINAAKSAESAIDLTNASTAVVKSLQAHIDDVRLACGGFCDVHILWGPQAFREFANHATVQARVNGGATRKEPSTITLEQVDALLGSGTKSRLSSSVGNSAALGQTVSNAFLLTTTIYIAAVSNASIPVDPSALKLFAGTGDPLNTSFYKHASGSHERAKWLWKEKLKVTNSGALKRVPFTV